MFAVGDCRSDWNRSDTSQLRIGKKKNVAHAMPLGMSQFEFSYKSRCSESLPDAVLLRIEQEARRNNLECGLSGEFDYADGVFQQVLEGPEGIIVPLAARILADQRHGDITIQSFKPISQRRFRGWVSRGFNFVAPTLARSVTDSGLVDVYSLQRSRSLDRRIVSRETARIHRMQPRPR